MARSRTKTAEATADTPEMDVFDQAIAEHQKAEAAAQVQQFAESTRIEPEQPVPENTRNSHAAAHTPSGNGHTAKAERKKFTPLKDPFDFESMKAGENRVILLKSEGEGAWVIRFAHPPNEDKGPNGETYSKENPHPVIKMLKEEGYRWGFDGGDGKGGWGKAFTGDAYVQDHIEARRVLQQAADIIGHKMDQGRIPD